jgi:hypothetical protein
MDGKPCYICKKKKNWTLCRCNAVNKGLSISSFLPLSWWPSVSILHGLASTPEIGSFSYWSHAQYRQSAEQCNKAMIFFLLESLILSSLHWQVFFFYLSMPLRQLSLSQTTTFIYVKCMNRDLCVYQQKWQLYCSLPTSMRHRSTSI